MSRLRVSKVFDNATVTITVVESVDVGCHQSVAGCQGYASLRVVAVVAQTPSGVQIFGIDDDAPDLERLRTELPELDGMLASRA